MSTRHILVGYRCFTHTTSSIYRRGKLKPRRGAQSSTVDAALFQIPSGPSISLEKVSSSEDASESNDQLLANNDESAILSPQAKPVHEQQALNDSQTDCTRPSASKFTDVIADSSNSRTSIVVTESRRCPYHPHRGLTSCPRKCR